MPEFLVEGWTKPIKHILKGDNIAEDLSGATVELVLRAQRSGVLIETTGDVTLEHVPGPPAYTIVTYNPDPTDIQAKHSPIEATYKVTDGSGKVHFYPNRDPDIWTVRR